MKKIALIASLFALVITGIAGTVDREARIALLQQLLDKTDQPLTRVALSTRINVLKLKEDPKDWEALKTYVHSIVPDDVGGPKFCASICFQIAAYDNPTYVKAAFTEANKTDYYYFVFSILTRFKKELGLSVEQEVEVLNNYLLSDYVKKNPARALAGVKYYTNVITDIDPAKAKAGLNKLNRTYSPYLIEDKTAWEPVVALIRTALETY